MTSDEGGAPSGGGLGNGAGSSTGAAAFGGSGSTPSEVPAHAVEACRATCDRMPFASCGEADDGAWQRCVDGCMAPFASLAGDCHDELFTLIDCMAANLDPGAACYREGDLCTGEGCPSSFSRNCARELMNLSLCGPPSLPAPLAMGCAFVGRQDDGSCTLDMTCGDITYTASCLGVTSALYDEFSVCDCSTAPPPPTWDAGVNAPIGRACVLWLRDCGAPL